MSTQTTQPLSLLHVDFDDLYARHLGRHSQFGINVGHLASLYGLWFGVYAALYQVLLHAGRPVGVAGHRGAWRPPISPSSPSMPRYPSTWQRRLSWPYSLPASLRLAQASRLDDPGVPADGAGLLQSAVVEPQDLDGRRRHDGIQQTFPARPLSHHHPAYL